MTGTMQVYFTQYFKTTSLPIIKKLKFTEKQNQAKSILLVSDNGKI